MKIWTSRVDSVGTETGKLLSNLADEVRGARQEDNEEGGEEGETQRTKKAKVGVIYRHRPGIDTYSCVNPGTSSGNHNRQVNHPTAGQET